MDAWLVQPPIGGTPADLTPPLGVLQLAASLERAGHRAHVVDLNLAAKAGRLDPRKNLRTQLVQAFPKRSSQLGLVGITTWSYNFGVAMELVLALRAKHPRVPIVLGGPHVTFVDREVLERFPEVDLCLRDEGDLTLPALAAALERGAGQAALEADLAAIPGLTWRRGREVVRNPSGPVVDDLDALPYPAYHLVDPAEYVARQPVLVVEAGRGCPYNCNFCSTSNMFQRRYRVKSAGRLLDEVEWLMARTGRNRFELLHDNLVASKQYVLGLCEEVRRRNLDLEWSCTSRTDNLTEELAEAMFLAGCTSIFFGVESLDPARQRWTGKRLVPAKVEAAVAMTARHHVTPSVGIIVGFPDETAAELDATVAAAARWTSDPRTRAEVSTAALRLYPGADLFALSERLAYDAAADADAAALPGLALRPEWRALTRLFPLAAIHTPPEETRRNLTVRNFVRTLLKACPNALRAAIDGLSLAPSALLARMAAGGRDGAPLAFLDDPRKETVWNETIGALARVLDEEGPRAGPALELLACEVPFFRTRPLVGPLPAPEHVVHARAWDHADLLAWSRGERPDGPAPAAPGASIVAVRAGAECLVWFTDDPERLLGAVLAALARDRAGVVALAEGLRRGL